MMSSEKFDVYGGNGGADGQYDFDLEIVNHKKIISNLEKLKSMRDMVIRDMKKNEDDFVPEIHSLISDWKGQYPNFRKMLRPKEMDWLLSKCVEDEDVINFVMKSGYKDELEMDEDGKPLLNRSTPLHHAANQFYDNSRRVRKLFEIYDRFDVNYINEFGCTHFHAACQYGFDDIVQKFLELGQDPNILPPKSAVDYEGDPVIPPLHVALEEDHRNVVELLLKNGADPNLATADGSTPLHVIVENGSYGYELADFFFKICDDENLTVRVNSQDHWGDTPLHRALVASCSYLTELLLRRGADPSLVNENGWTPLHISSHKGYDDGLMEVFFELNDKIGQTVLIDARDKKGRTPLHIALFCKHEDMIQVLLKNGADPNLANEEGLTPLHIISKRDEDDGLMKLFFEIIDDVRKTVQVDAVDNSGHTPLQWAVASLLPSTIDVLLDNGANLSRLNFTFPTVGHFDEKYKLRNRNRTIWFKLKFAYDTMAVVEQLEKRGYELDRSGAMTIMNAFDKHELFKRPANFDESRYDDEEFVKKAKEIMIKPSLSLYDLIRLRPEESITLNEMHEFLKTSTYYRFTKIYHDACDPYLCEIPTRRFFQKWAPDCLQELISSANNFKADLWRICLAATGRTEAQSVELIA